jgi:hypothetical protein
MALAGRVPSVTAWNCWWSRWSVSYQRWTVWSWLAQVAPGTARE